MNISFLLNHMRERLVNDNFFISDYMEQQLKELNDFLDKTILHGESNSMLIIGHRGAGKTHLLNKVLSKYYPSSDTDKTRFIFIYLNGLIHSNEQISLEEIFKQINLQNTSQTELIGNFTEKFQLLLNSFKLGNKNNISLVFVLDEFDLFCQHKNQTLLYNLFDNMQSSSMSICVIGLTVRLDVMELLEKRVKSRFSHNIKHLSIYYSFDDYLKIVNNFLAINSSDMNSKLMERWNMQLAEVLSEKTVRDILKRQYNLDQSLRTLKKLLISPISQLTIDRYLIEAGDLISSFNQINVTDSKSCIVHGLTVLELSLIIAMNNLSLTYDSEPFNFEMVFRSYHNFCQSKSSIQSFEKSIVLKSFEHLLQLEIVLPVNYSNDKRNTKRGSMMKEFRLMQLMLNSNDINETLVRYHNCPTDIKQWATSSF